MAFIELSDCLSRNSAILGPEYSRLGSTIKTGWLHRKVFLAVDPKKGWSVVQLNLFQCLLRKIFGFYKTTRLENVFRAWKNCTKDFRQKNPSLDNRLKTLMYSQKCPFEVVSNAPANEARVLCFPEEHTNHKIQYAIARYINEHYRDGDVVLFEGAIAGDSKRNQQVRLINKDISTFGWEPKDFEFLVAAASGWRHHNEMLEKIDQTREQLFPEDEEQAPSFDILESRLQTFIESIRELAVYFDPKGETPCTSIEKIAKEYFQKLKKEKCSYAAFQTLMLNFLGSLERGQQKVLHSNLDSNPEDVNIFYGSIEKRNHSMCQEIQKYLAKGKRVFVIAGKAHFLPLSPKEDPPCLKEIWSLLSQQKYLMLVPQV